MFSWSRNSGSSSSSPYPGNRNSTTQAPAPPPQPQVSSRYSRNEHIQSYLNHPTLKPSTRRVSRDDSTYDTVFQTRSAYALILRVHVPTQSSSTTSLPPPPGMSLVGIIATHPWIDTKMRVTGYDPIKSPQAWASSNLLLGDVVDSIVKHIQLNPPEVIEITDESLQRLQASISGGPGGRVGGQQNQSQPSYSNHTQAPPDYQTALGTGGGAPVEEDINIDLPPVPSSFPELETLSRSEMQELLDDDNKFQSFVQELPAVTTLNDLKWSIYKGNVVTAESNLKHQEELSELHAEVQSLRKSLGEKVENFRELEAQQAELTRPPDKRDIIKMLTKAKRDAFNESEDIASDWLDNGGEDDVDDFVEKFLERRTIHHVRAAKIERLTATM